MKRTTIAGILLLVLLWIWLGRAVIVYGGGFSLKNIMILTMTAIIIFVPIYKRYIRGDGKKD